MCAHIQTSTKTSLQPYMLYFCILRPNHFNRLRCDALRQPTTWISGRLCLSSRSWPQLFSCRGQDLVLNLGRYEVQYQGSQPLTMLLSPTVRHRKYYFPGLRLNPSTTWSPRSLPPFLPQQLHNHFQVLVLLMMCSEAYARILPAIKRVI